MLNSLIDHHRLGYPATWSTAPPQSNKYFCPKCAQEALLEELKQNEITAMGAKNEGDV